MMKRSAFAVIMATALIFGSQSRAQSDVEAEAAPAIADAAADIPVRLMGDADAPVTIDVFESFVCEPCAQWHTKVLPDLKTRYIDTGQAKLVFHDVMVEPVTQSAVAAMHGLCAAPASFFAVADSLMTGLLAIKAGGDGATWYEDAAKVSGRDPAEFQACLGSEATYNILLAENADPRAAAFPGFPGVTVNGAVVTDTSVQGIAAAILYGPGDN